jgi:hypothetical protein
MTTTTRTGAIYGIGVYGTSRYGITGVILVPDGVQAVGTTDSGVNITADSNHTVVSIVGYGLVGSIGPDQVIGDANVPVVGVVCTGSVNGNVTFKLDYKAVVASVQGTGNTSAPTIVAKALTSVSGVSSVGVVGTATIVAKAVTLVTGVEATGAVTTVTIAENARPTFDGVQAIGYVGSLTITTTSFDYNAVKELYAPLRTVYVARRTTDKDRTVVVPFVNRTVYVEANQSRDRVLLAA